MTTVTETVAEESTEPADDRIYLIQLVRSEPTGYGRSEYQTELQPGRGYFTSPEAARPTLDELNANFRSAHEAREAERLATAVRHHRMVVDPIPFEESDFLPRFTLAEIPPAPERPEMRPSSQEPLDGDDEPW